MGQRHRPGRSRCLCAGSAALATGAQEGVQPLPLLSHQGFARHRPAFPIVAFTPSDIVRHQLALSWGVQAFTVPKVATTDDMIRQVDSALRGLGHERGELAVIVAGAPFGQSGCTNTIRVAPGMAITGRA